MIVKKNQHVQTEHVVCRNKIFIKNLIFNLNLFVHILVL